MIDKAESRETANAELNNQVSAPGLGLDWGGTYCHSSQVKCVDPQGNDAIELAARRGC